MIANDIYTSDRPILLTHTDTYMTYLSIESQVITDLLWSKCDTTYTNKHIKARTVQRFGLCCVASPLFFCEGTNMHTWPGSNSASSILKDQSAGGRSSGGNCSA